MTTTHAPAPPHRRTPVLALLVVGALAHVGTRVSAIAIPWFVLATTGSPALTGLVTACELAPYVACKVLGGPITDRIGQRRVSLVADLASALALAAVPALHAADLLALPVLLGLVAVIGALRGPGDNAKHTSIPAVTDVAGWPLERSTGLFGAVERGSGLVAPGVAAVMITAFSPPGALLVTAVCFALSAALVTFFLPRHPAVPATVDPAAIDPAAIDPAAVESSSPPARTGYLHQLREGFTFLRRDRLLVLLAGMIMVTNLLDIAKTSVLLPVWAQGGGHGIAAMSLLLTCMAGFSMVSSLLASLIGRRLPRKLTYFVCFLVAGPGPYVVLGLDLPLGELVAVYCVAGFASGFLNPLLGAVTIERIPRPLLGRVSGIFESTAWAGMPLGGPLAGLLVALVGLGPAFLLCGALYLITTMVAGLLAGDRFDHNPLDDCTPEQAGEQERVSSAPASPPRPATRSGPPCPPAPARSDPGR